MDCGDVELVDVALRVATKVDCWPAVPFGGETLLIFFSWKEMREKKVEKRF